MVAAMSAPINDPTRNLLWRMVSGHPETTGWVLMCDRRRMGRVDACFQGQRCERPAQEVFQAFESEKTRAIRRPRFRESALTGST